MSTPSTIKTLSLPSDDKERPTIEFKAVRLKLASSDEILSWSHGEVTKPETINYRSQKPERDGLFCEKIFGPVKDWECVCGKYKKIRYRGIICDRCGVEITRSSVRRERIGHVALAAPVSHIWFLRSVPSRIGLILDLSTQSLEKVIYFANFIITDVKENLKRELLAKLEDEFKNKKKVLKKESDPKSGGVQKKIEQLTQSYNFVKQEIEEIQVKRIITEMTYRDLSMKYGHIFEAEIGAEAILKLLTKIDLAKLIQDLEREKRRTINPAKKEKIIQHLKLAKNFLINKIRPEWMILKAIPVIPPDLRPMVQLDGGRFASSDLNDLYRRVINRNNRLKRLQELHAPEVILRNEKRMLQEAVDALIDNEIRTSKTVTASTGQRRPLKSLADILKGKQGRFRQNLLGKRVDYSGRSVIVVGPQLKLHQCGLPKIMALELFKPFIISQLIKREYVHNVKSANRLIESRAKEIWDILEEVTKESYVLLNRAPTLHRLSIQAFQPILIEGKAIQIHPLVCPAFNADFDGDQMAVHLPITEQAHQEAKEIMLSSKNLLKPATGEPIVTPTKDMIWGAYYLTLINDIKPLDQVKVFADIKEAVYAYQAQKIRLQEKIKVRIDDKIVETSAGRLIFNSILPEGLYQMDQAVDNKALKNIIVNCLEIHGHETTVKLLDEIKTKTLFYLTKSGLSWGIDDLPELMGKEKIIQEADKKIDEIKKQYEDGLLAEDERYQKSIETWINVRDEITKLCHQALDRHNSVLLMIESGARGSWAQLTQMLGMKGIVSSPVGRLIELPVKNSFRDGFNVLEYFISTHGARKGVSDTALRTAHAGYLTRRLIDVAQDVIVREDDCGTKEGLVLTKAESEEMDRTLASRLFGRAAAENIVASSATCQRGMVNPKTKKVIVKQGEFITAEKVKELSQLDLEAVKIRSPLKCQTRGGICAKCYGYDLSYNQPVQIGAAVGIIAAQSIGEPGTQLTLRTFHTGGVAGRDITQGLPRVEELFEARPVKRKAILARHEGAVQVIQDEKQRKIRIKFRGAKEYLYPLEEEENWQIKVKNDQLVVKGDILARAEKQKITAKHNGKIKIEENLLKIIYESDDVEEYDVSGYTVWVKDKEKVQVGDQLTDGNSDLHELHELKGKEATQKYILKEIQYIYSSQGQNLNDRHIEVITRQMFSRWLVKDSGDTDLLPGEVVSCNFLEEANEKAKRAGRRPAEAKELLLGITRVSLSTDSWLAAASFQETSRVLVNTAITGRPDYLHGLKENVIIGRLIPAGTGLKGKVKT